MDVAGTAVGAVGLAIEFAKFAKKAYDVGRQIHQSGATEDNASLERIIKESMSFNRKLKSSLKKDVQKVHDEDFQELYEACLRESQALLKNLDSLKTNSQKSRFRVVVTNCWQAEKIEKAKLTVERLNEQLMQRLIAVSHIQNNSESKVSGDKQSPLNMIKEHLTSMSPDAAQGKELEELTALLLEFRVNARAHEFEQRIMSMLWYTDYRAKIMKMTGDEERRFHSSCEWIFTSDHSFSSWLREGDGMYWITGKAGSGKSVLMDFIANDPRTTSDLRLWAGPELVMASFFFWYQGPTAEQSQDGLLRSLLYEIIQAKPELARSLFSRRWKAFRSKPVEDSITKTELEEAITNLKRLKGDCSFCFFVDGLDEFVGGHNGLLTAIRQMTESKYIKICVSSRPWKVFSDYFTYEPRIQVHDLTRNNMSRYISRRLDTNFRWTDFCESDPAGTTALIEQIVDKAQGVFLWVRYVTTRLLEKMDEVNYIKRLEREVDKFPRDLKAYFKDMLTRLDDEEDFQLESRKIFLVALYSPTPLISLVYSFLSDEVDNDGRYVWAREENQLGDAELVTRSSTVKNCIHRHCQDLLEVYTQNGKRREMGALVGSSRPVHGKVRGGDRFVEYITKVDFLHRTGRDYLETNEGQNLIRTKSPFDPKEYILQASITLLRCQSSGTQKINRHDAMQAIMRPVIQIIENLVAAGAEPSVAFFDELDDAGYRSLDYASRTSTRHWTETFDSQCSNFLSFAVRLGLEQYVKMKLANYEDSMPAKEDLLLLAFKISRYHDPMLQLRISQLLLDAGARPNSTHFEAWSYLKDYHDEADKNYILAVQSIEDSLSLKGYTTKNCDSKLAGSVSEADSD